MRARPVKTPVLLLVGVALIWQSIFTAFAGRTPVVARAGCKCCESGCANYPTPACCAKPALPSVPLAPASARSRAQNQWQVLAVSAAASVVPGPQVADPSPAASLFIEPKAVPIFQRDCSYLP